MSWFDLGALVIIVVAIVDGVKSGLAWVVLEAMLLVIAALGARGLASHAEPYVLKVADLSGEDASAASHLVVFVLLACVFLGTMILIHPAFKRWRFRYDRWFAGVVGGLNGLFVALLLFSMAVWSHPRPAYEEALSESRLLAVLGFAERQGVTALLPTWVPERLDQLRRP